MAASVTCASPAVASTTIESVSLEPSTSQAGGHPDLGLSFSLAHSQGSEIAKDATLDAPPGLWLVPASVPACSTEEFADTECPVDSQVGLVTIRARHEGEPDFLLGTAPVFALEGSGQFGRLGFTVPVLESAVIASVSLQAANDYATRVAFEDLPESAPTTTIQLALWGVPADPTNDTSRFPRGSPGSPAGCPGQEPAGCTTMTPSNAPYTPFIKAPDTCQPQHLSATLSVRTYEDPQSPTQATSTYPGSTGCDQLSFNPSLYAEPTTETAHSPTGLDLNLTDPIENSPTIPSPSEFRSVVVRLPEAMRINPAFPEGHPFCTDGEAGVGNDEQADCPEGAELGTFTVELSGVTGPLVGEVYLGASETEEEEEGRLLLVAEGQGVDLKLPVGVSEDPDTGEIQLTLEQPQIPISRDGIRFFGGHEALFRTPLHCDAYPVEAQFTPWDAALSTPSSTEFFDINRGPGGADCLLEAANVGITLSPNTIPADGHSQSEVTIRVTDAQGAGIPEEDLKITSSDPRQQVGVVTDNEDGTYTTRITSSLTPGTATITATDLSVSPGLSASAPLLQSPTSTPRPNPPTPPRVRFTKKPPRRSQSHRPTFAFVADMAGAEFSCSLDRGSYHPCASPLRLPKLKVGAHSFSVRALAAGTTSTPAVWHFKVLRATHRERAEAN